MVDSKSFLRKIWPKDKGDIEAEVDIIAVHGLDPFDNPLHATKTWTASNDKLWLSDFLPNRNPRVRVFIYGYNSSAVFGASTAGINGAAENLLNYLRFERKQNPNRPIVWVAHSLGGIVVKKAIVNAYVSGEFYKNIHDATRGVVFFATPHRGGHLATLGDHMANICRVFSGGVRNNIMEALRKDSMFASDINKDFANRARALDLRVLNFIESLPIKGHIGLVVAPNSASLDWGEPAEILVRMEATHSSICKFEKENEMYRIVADNICDLLAWSIATASVNIEQAPRTSSGDTLLPTADHAARHEDLPDDHLLSEPSSAGNLGRPQNNRNHSSTWLEKLSALRPLFKTTSATPSETLSTSSHESLPESKLIWPICILPHPRPRLSSIMKRARLFENLLTASGSGPVALHGIGGVGKTQLAVRLAYWFLDRDPEFTVIWVHAASVETCAQGLRTLVEKCGILTPQEGGSMSDQGPRRTSITEVLTSVRRWLRKAPAHKWLLVFDSADNVDALTTPVVDPAVIGEGGHPPTMSIIDCVPTDGFVVFTTKSRAAADKFSQLHNGTTLEVGRFAIEEATLMLEMGVDDDLMMGTPMTPQQRSLTMEFGRAVPNSRPRQYRTDRASELAERLDCLPLAISQAAAFMNKNSLSTADYLSRMSATSDAMLAELMSRPQSLETQPGVPKSIYDTWRLSYEMIHNHNRLAVDILAFMSFLERDSIVLDLLQAAFSVGEDLKLFDALGELQDYELIHPGSTKGTYTMHRLVQATTQKWLKESKLDAQWARAALMTIAHEFPVPTTILSWPVCAAWLPHATKILKCPLFGTADSATLATLHLKVGSYYFETGRWSEARVSTQTACNLRAACLGPLAPETLEAKVQLIEVVRQLGELNLAEATAREVKRYRKRKLGKKHPLTLQSYRTLCLTLEDHGQGAEAMRYGEKALKGFQDLYGATEPLHPDILMSKYRLGAVYEMTGEFSKSEVYHAEALNGWKQRGEGESYHVSRVLYRLSYLQRALGKYRESERTARTCMEMRQKLLGPHHPDTMKAYFSAGRSMQVQERYEESTDVFIEVIKACKRIIGENHPYTYTASYYLAESLKGLGEYDQAKELHDSVLNGRKKVLRTNHPDVLISQVALASMLLILGNSKKSEELTLEVYNIVKKEGKMTTERSPITWMCMSNMAKIHAERAATTKTASDKQVQWKEAIRWGRRLVEAQEHMVGSKHPETIKASKQLAGYLNASNERTNSNTIHDNLSSITLGEDDEGTKSLKSKSIEEKPEMPRQ